MNSIEVVLAGPYNLFYAGGFALAFAAAAVQGRRRGWPMLPWLALLAACVAGGIAGSKLLHFDLHAAGPGEKTILGGLAGGMLALLLAQRFLRFERATAIVLAPAVLLGFALGRVGCFLIGCCFGLPASVPWAVRYPEGTPPFAAQSAAGLLDFAAAVSLPVHPTQLYEAVLALLLAAAICRWGGSLRSVGGAALLLVAGFGAMRIGVEFFRAGGEAELVLGLKTVQWTLLVAAVSAAAALAWRERRARSATAEAIGVRETIHPTTGEVALGRAAWLTAGLITAALAAGGVPTPLERAVLVAGLAPAAVALLSAVLLAGDWRRIAAGAATATSALILVPLPADTVPVYPRSFFTAGVSGMAGEYQVEDPPADEGCGPRELHEHVYRVYGGSLGYTRVTAQSESYSARIRGFFGTDELRRVDGVAAGVETQIRGASVSGTIDSEWFGVTGGLIGGDRVDDEGRPDSGLGVVAGVRGGRLDSFFFTASYLDHEPGPYPDTRLKLSAGYGFGQHASNFRVGAWERGVFVGGTLVTRQGLEIEPYGGIVTDEGGNQFGIAVRQRF